MVNCVSAMVSQVTIVLETMITWLVCMQVKILINILGTALSIQDTMFPALLILT